MKILQLGKFYPIRGGVEKVMYDMLLGLSARQITCDMLCATTEGFAGGTLKINPYATVFAIPTTVKAAATMLAPKMISVLRKIAPQYDIIMIHHPDPMAALALFLSGYKGRVILHWHSDILKQKNLLKIYKPLQNWLLKRADLITGTTPVYVEKSPFLTDSKQKIDYIPIGIEPLKSDPQQADVIRSRYPNKKIVFSLGRLVAYKGFDDLIESALYLPDDFVVLIGGKGPLFDELNAKIKAFELEEKVKLLGFLSDEELPPYFEASDVFCLSSTIKTEAFAIVQLEAMSCKKPIVSTDIPESGVAWVNKNNDSGLVVPIHQARALAEAVIRITRDKAVYEAYSKRSYDRFMAHFTRDKMIDKCETIFKRVLSL